VTSLRATDHGVTIVAFAPDAGWLFQPPQPHRQLLVRAPSLAVQIAPKQYFARLVNGKISKGQIR
jgi:hypothetical protein